MGRDLGLVRLGQLLLCVVMLLLCAGPASASVPVAKSENYYSPTTSSNDTTANSILIAGPDTVCTRNLPITYLGTPAGGKFIVPKGLPLGLVTVKENQLTLNPGFDIINTSFRYQVNGPNGGSTSTKYLTITAPLNPRITKPVTICAGNYAVLEVENCPGEVIWSTGTRSSVTVVTPNTTTKYSARCIVNKCDTTLTTEVVVSGIYPDVKIIGVVCSEDKKSYTLSFDAPANVTVTHSLGTLVGNQIVDLPVLKTLNVKFSINECSGTFSTNGSGCVYPPNCPRIISSMVVGSAATCTGSKANGDASISLGFPLLADRYTYAGTAAELATYGDAIVLTGKKLIISNLPNPNSPTDKTYYLRFYRGSESCSFDTTVVVPYRDCSILCAKPNAGNDLFVSRHHNEVKLPDATIRQKWIVSPENPLGEKNLTIIDPSTGFVSGLYPSGKYAFILTDAGAGGSCADTAFVYAGTNELTPLFTYSDTLTLPKYILNPDPGATYGVWHSIYNNSATLSSTCVVSGLTYPGSYSFMIFNPYNPNNALPVNDTLVLTVIRLAKPDDCPPNQCTPFSLKKIKSAAK